MLDVTKTALPGIGVSMPVVVERDAMHYLKIAVSGPMRALPQFAPPKLIELSGRIAQAGEKPLVSLFRYRRFGSDGSVDLDVGMTTTGTPALDDVAMAELPAGRYATLSYTGPYDRLYDAFCMLQGWIEARGLVACGEPSEPDCQAELYRIGPMQTNDPMQWQTDLLVKLAQ